MIKKIAIIISPNWRDYAKKYLAGCFDSIKKQDYAGEMKIFIADNESTEASYGYLRSVLSEDKIPLTPFAKGGEYEIVRNKYNDGFAKGNNDCMKLALAQGFEYVILFNMDTVLEPDCVSKMAEIIENDNKEMDCSSVLASVLKKKTECFRGNDKRGAGAVQARLMLHGDKNKINSLGNVTHFLGFGYASGYGEKYNPPNPPYQGGNAICYPSGAAVLFKAEALEKVGLFDETMWMYNEDQDLGWRLWLAGFKCVLATDAVAYHKYEFSRSIKKYYFMDRNRIMAMLKNYHWATLVLIAPAFLVMEIGLIFFAFKGGWFKEKIGVYKYFFKPKNWRYIMAARRQVQKLRQVKDKDIIKLFSGRIWYQEIGDSRLKIANIIFGAYWRVIRVLIFW